MRMMKRLLGALGGLVRRRQAEQDLDEELRAYLEAAADSRSAAGLDRETALRAARAEMGSPEAIKDHVRDAGWESFPITVWQDVRYAGRTLRKGPGFSAAAILTLALGIGANTTIFSALDAVLLRPLPYPEPDRLVQVWEVLPNGRSNNVSGGVFVDWRDHRPAVEAIALVHPVMLNLRTDGGADRLAGMEVTHEIFGVLGVAPLRGRFFLRNEERVGGANDVVILTEETWTSRFGADESLVGRTVVLDEVPRTVVGILPAGTWMYDNAEFFVPAVLKPGDEDRSSRSSHWADVYARLKPGVTVAEADAAFKRLRAALAPEYPGYKREWSVRVVPLRQTLSGDPRPVLLTLVGAVALVLLIACANVANLLVARAASRQREVGLRAALGASRTRIVRQVLTESLVLALLGGLGGAVLSVWGIRLLARWASDLLPRAMTPQLDVRVLAATLAISCGTGLLFGILPAWKAGRVPLSESLRAGGDRAASPRRSRLHAALIVSEVALTVVLLAAAGLLFRSLARTAAVDPGFEARGAFTFDLSLPESTYPTDEHKVAFAQAAIARVESLPGVEAAAVSLGSPLVWGGPGEYFSRTDRPETRFDRLGRINFVSERYLEAIGARLLRGRTLTAQDNRADAAPVTLVNEEVVRVFFPGEDPIGQRLTVAGATLEIVGVVADMKIRSLEEPPALCAYPPFAFLPKRMAMIVRTTPDPATMMDAVQAEMLRLDPGVALANVRTLEGALAGSLERRRFVLALIAGFAAAALALACIGLYGVMSYTVAARRRELCVRMALGAARRDVVGLILRDGIALTAAGVAAGLAAAVGAARLLGSQLFEVRGHDPLALGGTVAIITLVAVAACWLPARQATRLSPMAALGSD